MQTLSSLCLSVIEAVPLRPKWSIYFWSIRNSCDNPYIAGVLSNIFVHLFFFLLWFSCSFSCVIDRQACKVTLIYIALILLLFGVSKTLGEVCIYTYIYIFLSFILWLLKWTSSSVSVHLVKMTDADKQFAFLKTNIFCHIKRWQHGSGDEMRQVGPWDTKKTKAQSNIPKGIGVHLHHHCWKAVIWIFNQIVWPCDLKRAFSDLVKTQTLHASVTSVSTCVNVWAALTWALCSPQIHMDTVEGANTLVWDVSRRASLSCPFTKSASMDPVHNYGFPAVCWNYDSTKHCTDDWPVLSYNSEDTRPSPRFFLEGLNYFFLSPIIFIRKSALWI